MSAIYGTPPETILALRRSLHASTDGLATTSTVLDEEEGDTSNDEENSNDGKSHISIIAHLKR